MKESLTAHELEWNRDTGDVRARGDVQLKYQDSELNSEAILFNLEGQTGELYNAYGNFGDYLFRGEKVRVLPNGDIEIEHAEGSTCNLKHPHWTVGARYLKIKNKNKAETRNLRFKMFGTSLFSIARYNFSLTRSEEALLPIPGFNKIDGLFLQLNYPLILPEVTAGMYRAQLTQKNGLNYIVELQRSISKHGDEAPGIRRDVTSDFTSYRFLSKFNEWANIPRYPSEMKKRKYADQSTRVFIKFANKSRVFDPETRYVTLDSQPEIGIKLLDYPINVRAKQITSLAYDFQASHGSFREREQGVWRDRTDYRAILKAKTTLGKPLEFEPSFLIRHSDYSTGGHQTVSAISMAVGRSIAKDYFLSATYVRHWTNGRSPFEFDNIDIISKLAASLDCFWGDTRGNFVADIDLDKGTLFDWTVQLARKAHCIEPMVKYQNRFRSLSFQINLAASL